MINFWQYIRASLDNLTPGASAKKLTAFILMALVVYIHFGYCRLSNCVEFLITDLTTITALLGVSTYESLKKKKNDETDVTT